MQILEPRRKISPAGSSTSYTPTALRGKYRTWLSISRLGHAVHEDLKQSLDLMLGRLGALQVGLWMVAASLPPGAKKVAAAKMQEATERVHADALALPLPETQVEEMHRLMLELTMILNSPSQELG